MSCQIRKTRLMAQAGCSEKPTNPQARAEFDSKLAQLQAERVRQDTMWSTISEQTAECANSKCASIHDNPIAQGVSKTGRTGAQ